MSALLNGDQMGTIAHECADKLLEQMRVALPAFTDAQHSIILGALEIAWLEGFGRGSKVARKIAEDALETAIKRLTAAASEAVGLPKVSG